MSGARTHLGLFVLVAALLIGFSQLPLGTALEFSSDEGFELMKGFLCSKGYILYREIWSDQPPLYTLLLKWVFTAAGPSVLAARVVGAGFALLMFAVFFDLVRERSGQGAGAFATLLLIASPVVLLLSVAVMKEVAAFGTGLLAAWLLREQSRRPHWGWLLGSAVVMALAAQIKFSALMIVPAMLAEFVMGAPGQRWPQERPRRGRRNRSASKPTVSTAAPPHRRLTRSLIFWIASFLVILSALGVVFSRGSFEASFKAHFTGHSIAGLQNREDIRFPFSLLLDHAECAACAVTGIYLVLRRRLWADLAFPGVLLLTGVAVHAVHRPWWNYYYLHLAIPLSWLAGIAIAETVRVTSGLFCRGGFQPGRASTWQGLALSALIALALTRSLGRLEAAAKDLREQPRISASQVIAKMKENALSTHWVYAENPIYAFHAQLLVPPELAVVTPKRFWSGQISTQDILAICKERQVEQVLLSPTRIDHVWTEWLRTNYAPAYKDARQVLYVIKRG